ncbi:glycosyltransferase family 1 protein [Picosynechococcus sp. PCC 7117]|uniref:glycosyltransferase family 4 protein n=1 Tax=Picosynechococcus sp. PCC 7117 TaxID=195498 RepID=UPI00081050FF|nr:glycosyltransferase family 1 protein [Picosynechococcus sp. PCC 7117]ANV87364.1 group 1 glycosyl transferase [Picosynechococcus sp. PCC 7117]
MQISSYIHPVRTYLPCTGVGRHINAVVQELSCQKTISLNLLVSKQLLGADQKLDHRCPLRDLPTQTFPTPENPTERSWKLLGLPKLDRHIPDGTDWVYAPMETYLPVSKCPVAITLHDIQAFESQLPWSQSWQHRWFRYKWGRWVRRSLNDSRVVFTVSEFSKQRMVALLGADPRKIVVIGNGIDQPFFDIATTPPDTLPSPVEAPYVFMIGGLRKKKGGDSFLEVAKHLRQRKSDIHIVIAGRSDPDYIEAAKDHPNITLLGVVSDEDLPLLLRRSLGLLFLSLYEGFGIPALEAMAAGVPAVVANRASLPEVVGDAGIIVDPDKPDNIVDILITLENNTRFRQDYIQRGQQHAAAHTWSACADRVIEAFQTFA